MADNTPNPLKPESKVCLIFSTPGSAHVSVCRVSYLSIALLPVSSFVPPLCLLIRPLLTLQACFLAATFLSVVLYVVRVPASQPDGACRISIASARLSKSLGPVRNLPQMGGALPTAESTDSTSARLRR